VRQPQPFCTLCIPSHHTSSAVSPPCMVPLRVESNKQRLHLVDSSTARVSGACTSSSVVWAPPRLHCNFQ